MFLSAPANPTRVKHTLYVLASVVLGVIVSYLAHAGIEAVFLSRADANGLIIHWYGSCALHLALQIGLVVLGAIGGLYLGRFWWRKVYIERVWANGRSKR